MHVLQVSSTLFHVMTGHADSLFGGGGCGTTGDDDGALLRWREQLSLLLRGTAGEPSARAITRLGDALHADGQVSFHASCAHTEWLCFNLYM